MNAKNYKHYATAAKLCREYFKKEADRTRQLIQDERAKGEDANADYIARCESLLAAPYHNRPRKGSYLAWIAREEKRLKETTAAGRLLAVDIRVEWTRSRTWGNVPHAEVFINYQCQDGIRSKVATGTASGCGYCKESAAVSSALSEFPEVTRFVVECGPKLWGLYAVEREPVPRLSFGGKGIETLRTFFREAGWTWEEDHGRRFDIYHAKRKEAR